MYSLKLRILSFLVLSVFVCQDLSWAAEEALASLHIPRSLGLRQSSYISQSGETIIHIQDAHDSLDAQKKIAGLLEFLSTHHAVRSVALEGASGDIDAALFRSYPDPEWARSAADTLLKEGYLNAGEFFAATTRQDVAVYGVEDRQVYRENLKAFRELLSAYRQMQSGLRGLRKTIEVLKERIYNQRLMDLERMRGEFQQRIERLMAMAEQDGISVSDLKNASELQKLIRSERGIRFEEANGQRDALIGRITELSGENGADILLRDSLNFKKGEITDTEYYIKLHQTALNLGIDLSAYSELEKYITYLRQFDLLNLAEILRESEELERRVRQANLGGREEMILERLSRQTDLILNLVSAKASSEEYQTYLDNPIDSAMFESQLKELAGAHQVPIYEGFRMSDLQPLLQTALRFYALARERDDHLIQNTLRRMRQKGQRVAALVTGGFHTQGMTDHLKKENLTHWVIMPSMSDGENKRPYAAILEADRSQILIGGALDTGFANPDRKRHWNRYVETLANGPADLSRWIRNLRTSDSPVARAGEVYRKLIKLNLEPRAARLASKPRKTQDSKTEEASLKDWVKLVVFGSIIVGTILLGMNLVERWVRRNRPAQPPVAGPQEFERRALTKPSKDNPIVMRHPRVPNYTVELWIDETAPVLPAEARKHQFLCRLMARMRHGDREVTETLRTYVSSQDHPINEWGLTTAEDSTDQYFVGRFNGEIVDRELFHLDEAGGLRVRTFMLDGQSDGFAPYHLLISPFGMMVQAPAAPTRFIMDRFFPGEATTAPNLPALQRAIIVALLKEYRTYQHVASGTLGQNPQNFFFLLKSDNPKDFMLVTGPLSGADNRASLYHIQVKAWTAWEDGQPVTYASFDARVHPDLPGLKDNADKLNVMVLRGLSLDGAVPAAGKVEASYRGRPMNAVLFFDQYLIGLQEGGARLADTFNVVSRSDDPFSLEAFEEAEELLDQAGVINTPLVELPELSRQIGKQVLYKDEAFQIAGSFKFRGVYNQVHRKIESLLKERTSDNTRLDGIAIVTQSTGNHGIAMIHAVAKAIEHFAFHTRYGRDPRLRRAILSIKPRVYTWRNLPSVKQERMSQAIEAYNEVTQQYLTLQDIVKLDFDSYEDAKQARMEFVNRSGGKAHYMDHSGQDIRIGHGTVALEISDQLFDFNIDSDQKIVLVLPVGEGGPIGIAAAMRAARPDNTNCLLVQPVGMDALIRSIRSGRLESNPKVAVPVDILDGLPVYFSDGVMVDGPADMEIVELVKAQFSDYHSASETEAYQLAAPMLWRDLHAQYEGDASWPVAVGGTSALGVQAVREGFNEIPILKSADVIVILGTEGNVPEAVNADIERRARQEGSRLADNGRLTALQRDIIDFMSGSAEVWHSVDRLKVSGSEQSANIRRSNTEVFRQSLELLAAEGYLSTQSDGWSDSEYKFLTKRPKSPHEDQFTQALAPLDDQTKIEADQILNRQHALSRFANLRDIQLLHTHYRLSTENGQGDWAVHTAIVQRTLTAIRDRADRWRRKNYRITDIPLEVRLLILGYDYKGNRGEYLGQTYMSESKQLRAFLTNNFHRDAEKGGYTLRPGRGAALKRQFEKSIAHAVELRDQDSDNLFKQSLQEAITIAQKEFPDLALASNEVKKELPLAEIFRANALIAIHEIQNPEDGEPAYAWRHNVAQRIRERSQRTQGDVLPAFSFLKKHQLIRALPKQIYVANYPDAEPYLQDVPPNSEIYELPPKVRTRLTSLMKKFTGQELTQAVAEYINDGSRLSLLQEARVKEAIQQGQFPGELQDRPIVMEIGSGKGGVLIAQAAADARTFWIGFEPSVQSVTNAHVDSYELPNIAWVPSRIQDWVERHGWLYAGKVDRIEWNFPTPSDIPKQGDEILRVAERLLKPDGRLVIISEVPFYDDRAYAQHFIGLDEIMSRRSWTGFGMTYPIDEAPAVIRESYIYKALVNSKVRESGIRIQQLYRLEAQPPAMGARLASANGEVVWRLASQVPLESRLRYFVYYGLLPLSDEFFKNSVFWGVLGLVAAHVNPTDMDELERWRAVIPQSMQVGMGEYFSLIHSDWLNQVDNWMMESVRQGQAITPDRFRNEFSSNGSGSRLGAVEDAFHDLGNHHDEIVAEALAVINEAIVRRGWQLADDEATRNNQIEALLYELSSMRSGNRKRAAQIIVKLHSFPMTKLFAYFLNPDIQGREQETGYDPVMGLKLGSEAALFAIKLIAADPDRRESTLNQLSKDPQSEKILNQLAYIKSHAMDYDMYAVDAADDMLRWIQRLTQPAHASRLSEESVVPVHIFDPKNVIAFTDSDPMSAVGKRNPLMGVTSGFVHISDMDPELIGMIGFNNTVEPVMRLFAYSPTKPIHKLYPMRNFEHIDIPGVAGADGVVMKNPQGNIVGLFFSDLRHYTYAEWKQQKRPSWEYPLAESTKLKQVDISTSQFKGDAVIEAVLHDKSAQQILVLAWESDGSGNGKVRAVRFPDNPSGFTDITYQTESVFTDVLENPISSCYDPVRSLIWVIDYKKKHYDREKVHVLYAFKADKTSRHYALAYSTALENIKVADYAARKKFMSIAVDPRGADKPMYIFNPDEDYVYVLDIRTGELGGISLSVERVYDLDSVFNAPTLTDRTSPILVDPARGHLFIAANTRSGTHWYVMPSVDKYRGAEQKQASVSAWDAIRRLTEQNRSIVNPIGYPASVWIGQDADQTEYLNVLDTNGLGFVEQYHIPNPLTDVWQLTHNLRTRTVASMDQKFVPHGFKRYKTRSDSPSEVMAPDPMVADSGHWNIALETDARDVRLGIERPGLTGGLRVTYREQHASTIPIPGLYKDVSDVETSVAVNASGEIMILQAYWPTRLKRIGYGQLVWNDNRTRIELKDFKWQDLQSNSLGRPHRVLTIQDRFYALDWGVSGINRMIRIEPESDSAEGARLAQSKAYLPKTLDRVAKGLKSMRNLYPGASFTSHELRQALRITHTQMSYLLDIAQNLNLIKIASRKGILNKYILGEAADEFIANIEARRYHVYSKASSITDEPEPMPESQILEFDLAEQNFMVLVTPKFADPERKRVHEIEVYAEMDDPKNGQLLFHTQISQTYPRGRLWNRKKIVQHVIDKIEDKDYLSKLNTAYAVISDPDAKESAKNAARENLVEAAREIWANVVVSVGVPKADDLLDGARLATRADVAKVVGKFLPKIYQGTTPESLLERPPVIAVAIPENGIDEKWIESINRTSLMYRIAFNIRHLDDNDAYLVLIYPEHSEADNVRKFILSLLSQYETAARIKPRAADMPNVWITDIEVQDRSLDIIYRPLAVHEDRLEHIESGLDALTKVHYLHPRIRDHYEAYLLNSDSNTYEDIRSFEEAALVVALHRDGIQSEIESTGRMDGYDITHLYAYLNALQTLIEHALRLEDHLLEADAGAAAWHDYARHLETRVREARRYYPAIVEFLRSEPVSSWYTDTNDERLGLLQYFGGETSDIMASAVARRLHETRARADKRSSGTRLSIGTELIQTLVYADRDLQSLSRGEKAELGRLLPQWLPEIAPKTLTAQDMQTALLDVQMRMFEADIQKPAPPISGPKIAVWSTDDLGPLESLIRHKINRQNNRQITDYFVSNVEDMDAFIQGIIASHAARGVTLEPGDILRITGSDFARADDTLEKTPYRVLRLNEYAGFQAKEAADRILTGGESQPIDIKGLIYIGNGIYSLTLTRFDLNREWKRLLNLLSTQTSA